MNKRQKEVEAAKLSAEEKELKHLKTIYNKASEDIQKKIRISDGKINFLLSEFDNLDDEQKSVLQSQIYQRRFQESLQKQIDGFTASLNSGQYKSINEYLKGCYETGYIGTMYDIAGQGIPLIMPIDQKKITKAMTHNTKLSTTLYKRLGVDLNLLKKRIANNISRGIATASEYKVIARNIAANSNVGFNRSMRIARTEGHRIQIESAVDAQHAAKDAGADIVKQWDASLDGRTRPHHRMLDGQIRELDEDFEVDGMKVKYPSGFGRASEDINCRCALLQRARWALDEEELNKLKERAEYFGLDKTKDFDDFKKKYLNLPEDADNADIRVLEKPVESNDAHYKKCIDIFKNAGVEYNSVKSHTRKLTQEEIIKELAGADKTSGSCASVAMTYIGQKLGLNVHDFRGGKSMESFRGWDNLESLVQMEGIKVLRAKGASSLTVGNRLLKKVEQGKEYYLCVGKHASIVRKTEEGVLQYLELQADYSESARYGAGWHDFTSNPKRILNWRFGCNGTSNPWHEKLDFMIDIDESELNTDEIKSILGYINTDVGKEVKGEGGMLK